jgi:phosphinothricin acetyltransferase
MLPGVDREPIVVRAAEPGDADQLNEIYNHYVRTSHVTFDIEPMSLDRRREWLRERSGGSHRVLVAHHAKRVLGFASSGPHRDRPAYDTAPSRGSRSRTLPRSLCIAASGSPR